MAETPFSRSRARTHRQQRMQASWSNANEWIGFVDRARAGHSRRRAGAVTLSQRQQLVAGPAHAGTVSPKRKIQDGPALGVEAITFGTHHETVGGGHDARGMESLPSVELDQAHSTGAVGRQARVMAERRDGDPGRPSCLEHRRPWSERDLPPVDDH